MRDYKGLGFSFLSMVLMSLAGPLQKRALQESSLWLVIAVSSFATFVAAGVGWWIARPAGKIVFQKPSKGLVFLSGLYASAMIFFAGAVHLENPLIVSFVARLYIVFSVAFSLLWLKETTSKRSYLAFAFIIVGSFLSGIRFEVNVLVGKDFLSAGSGCALIYALLFAVHNTSLKSQGRVPVTNLLLLQSLVTLAASVVPLLFRVTVSWTATSLACAALSGVLSSYFGFVFYHRSLQILTLGEATSLRSLSPLVALLVIAPLYPPTWTMPLVTGITLTIFGCLLINFRRRPHATTTH